MLVLTRKVGERIQIGENIVITVVRLQNDKVRIGIEAPTNVPVHREEVLVRRESATTLVPVLAPRVFENPQLSGLSRRLASRG